MPMQDMQSNQRRKTSEKQTVGRQGTAESNNTLPVYKHTATIPPVYLDENGPEQFSAPAETAKDLATEVIHALDDPDLNPVCHRLHC